MCRNDTLSNVLEMSSESVRQSPAERIIRCRQSKVFTPVGWDHMQVWPQGDFQCLGKGVFKDKRHTLLSWAAAAGGGLAQAGSLTKAKII